MTSWRSYELTRHVCLRQHAHHREKDFLELVSGKLQPVQAFMGGKIKVKGNMGVLMKLQGLQPKLEKMRAKY